MKRWRSLTRRRNVCKYEFTVVVLFMFGASWNSPFVTRSLSFLFFSFRSFLWVFFDWSCVRFTVKRANLRFWTFICSLSFMFIHSFRKKERNSGVILRLKLKRFCFCLSFTSFYFWLNLSFVPSKRCVVSKNKNLNISDKPAALLISRKSVE